LELNLNQKKIIIGTRPSKLALWQSEWVKSALESLVGLATCCRRDGLEKNHPQLKFELRIIHTTGDKILDTALSKIGDKGLFTKEIEQQLVDGAIDLAVHSLKDLPTVLPDGLGIGAVTARQDPADVLISKNSLTLEQLPKGAVVLTGSLRRRAQLLHRRSDLQIQDLRGNIATRLRKLDKSDAQAIIMAGAALKRLALQDRITEHLDPTDFLPACGQGALAVEIRIDDTATADLIAPLQDHLSRTTTTAERTVLAGLEGGCQIPVGAYARVQNEKLLLNAMIADLAGTKLLRTQAQGSTESPEELGRQVAQKLLEMGGRQILTQIRQEYQNNEPAS